MGDPDGDGLALHVEVRWGCSTIAIVHRAVPCSFTVATEPDPDVDLVVPAGFVDGDRVSLVSVAPHGAARVVAGSGVVDLPVGERTTVELGAPEGLSVAIEVARALPRASRWRAPSRAAVAWMVVAAALHGAALFASSRLALPPTEEDRLDDQRRAITLVVARIEEIEAASLEAASLEAYTEVFARQETAEECLQRCWKRGPCGCNRQWPNERRMLARQENRRVNEPENPLASLGARPEECWPSIVGGTEFPEEETLLGTPGPGAAIRRASICASPYAPSISAWSRDAVDYPDLEAMSVDDIARASVGDRQGPGVWWPAAHAVLDGSAARLDLEVRQRDDHRMTAALAREVRARTGALRLCAGRDLSFEGAKLKVRLAHPQDGWWYGYDAHVDGAAPLVVKACIIAALRDFHPWHVRTGLEIVVSYVPQARPKR